MDGNTGADRTKSVISVVKREIEVVSTDGEHICTVVYYPGNETIFQRNVIRLFEALHGGMKQKGINVPDFPDEPTPPETEDEDAIAAYEKGMEDHLKGFESALDTIMPSLSKIADNIDAIIEAGDKIAGQGVTEKILETDDNDWTNFNIVFAPIFEEYARQRGEKTSKYRAKKH